MNEKVDTCRWMDEKMDGQTLVGTGWMNELMHGWTDVNR